MRWQLNSGLRSSNYILIILIRLSIFNFLIYSLDRDIIAIKKIMFFILCLSDDCLEYGEFKYRCHTYPAHNCARAGKIGKARIRTLKMTLVIGKSCVIGTNSNVV